VKISFNWLKRYVDLPEPPEQIARDLTMLGFEVDAVETVGAPPLERLGVCRVALGDELGERSIVCGATNYKVGDRVPVALPGATLPGGFKIKRSKLRGVVSEGMMCSAKELGLGEDHAGLLLLENRPALGAPLKEVLGEGDTVFTLEVTPNRPDCLSHIGIARELAAWFRRPLAYPPAEGIAPSDERPRASGLFEGVSVDCPEDCPLYLAFVLRGATVQPSPDWMQKLLRSVGLRPINNVVDVTNFVLLETGNPMHAFDADCLKGREIRVRHARKGERLVTLDGQERALDSRSTVIADAERALAVGGVMGGLDSEIKPDTTDIVLEVACFKPASIRRTAKRLGLSTDSSYRFERGVDADNVRYAGERAAALILETGAGQLCSPVFEADARLPLEREISLSVDWARQLLGFPVPNEDMQRSLEALEMQVRAREGNDDDDEIWLVTPPSHRGDLDRPIDLVEEILRLYGTHRIPPGRVRAVPSAEPDDTVSEFFRQTSALLVGQQFAEAVNYTLRSEAEEVAWSDDPAAAPSELALSNPISEDQTRLRQSLLPGLLDTLRLNQYRKTGQTRFFEIGRVFSELDGRVVEMLSVAFLEGGEGRDRSWRPPPEEDFFSVKRRLFDVAARAGIDLDRFPIRPVEESAAAWQPGHAARVEEPKAGLVAASGMLSLARLREADIKGTVLAGSFCLLPERLKPAKRPVFRPFSAYPPSMRDLALAVDRSTLVRDVLEAVGMRAAETVKEAAFEVEKIDVFDLYQGKGLPEGKKSVALSIAYRSQERTLTDKEVNQAFEALQQAIRESTGFEVRD